LREPPQFLISLLSYTLFLGQTPLPGWFFRKPPSLPEKGSLMTSPLFFPEASLVTVFPLPFFFFLKSLLGTSGGTIFFVRGDVSQNGPFQDSSSTENLPLISHLRTLFPSLGPPFLCYSQKQATASGSPVSRPKLSFFFPAFASPFPPFFPTQLFGWYADATPFPPAVANETLFPQTTLFFPPLFSNSSLKERLAPFFWRGDWPLHGTTYLFFSFPDFTSWRQPGLDFRRFSVLVGPDTLDYDFPRNR